MDMDKVYEARRLNLLELIARLGGRGAIATIQKRLGYTWPGFVSQMKSRPGQYGHRQMTEATARAIEVAFGLPTGSMDKHPLPPERSVPAPPAKPTGNTTVVVLADAADRAGVHLGPEKLAAALRAMEAAGRSDREYADLVVALLK